MTELIIHWIFMFSLIGGYNTVDLMYVKQGSNVVFKCPYKPVKFWSDPATKETFAFGLDINPHMDISKRLNITADFDLIIHNFTSTDVRTYRCTRQQGKQPPKTFNFKPILPQKPSDMKINGKREIQILHVDEGIKFTLNCSVDSGKPAGTLEWIRNGQHLTLGVHHVSFAFIPKKLDNGDNYTCSANNPASDQPLTSTIQLFLNLRPRISVTADPSTNVNEGHTLTLTCNYTSNIQYDKILWLKKKETSSDLGEPIKSRNLTISFDKVSREDMGQYVCQVTNRVGTDSSKINITVNFPPTIFNQKGNYKINGEYGKLSKIRVMIYCFPSLIVSWSLTAGGKLGSWTSRPEGNVIEVFRHSFTLESTILPTQEEHFGQYHAIVRNSRGSVELVIQLDMTEELKVNIFPHAPVCTSQDAVELFCNISSKGNVHWNVNWEHYFNRLHIRTLQGITNQQRSSLVINHCDFQDEGQYICKWNINNRRLVGSTILVVNDRPVFSNQELAEDESCLILSVYFYDNTNSSLVSWFVNNEKLSENGSTYQVMVKRSDVTLRVYEKQVRANGFCSELVFPKRLLTYTKSVNCEIQNKVGRIAALFRKSELLKYLNTASVANGSSQINHSTTLDSRYKTTNILAITIQPNISEMIHFSTESIHVAVSGLFVLLFCSVMFTVCKYKSIRNLCAKHVYELRSVEVTQNNQDQNAVQYRAIYEDIDNSQYLTVEAEDNEIANDEPEIAGQNDVISSLHVEPINQNIYEEINSAYYEDVDWRNSIVSSEESCIEQDFHYNIDNNQYDLRDAHNTFCYLNVLCDSNTVHHENSESDNQHNNDLAELPEKPHLYFTVLSND